ncbi:LPP20 family lipoprotein [Marinobacter sp. VGCF2001]|uniref:LPP20 family lipoprotein n=1 Tax=Marinobacter sp. VGCF2001 TaxID=3417189 RepID=UPI003CF7105A
MRSILLFPALVLSACATTGPAQLPDWVLAPPADNASTLYGVGEGAALRTARDDALAVIAGKLEVRVTSDVLTETTLTNGQEDSSTRNSVRTTTEALKLSEYQTENSAQVGNRLFVLLSIKRQTLVTSLLNDVERLDREISARLSNSGDQSRLKRLYRLTLAKSLVSEALDKVLLVQSVSQNPGLKQQQAAQYQNLLEERERLQQNLTLAVAWDKHTTQIGERVLTMLLEAGLHAEANKPGAAYDGRIVVAGTPSQREIFNEFHVQLNAVVSLQDNRGSEISSARYKAAASSLSNHQSAQKTANRQIADDVQEQGIWRALNMHKGT